jgi:hypothetical protein
MTSLASVDQRFQVSSVLCHASKFPYFSDVHPSNTLQKPLTILRQMRYIRLHRSVASLFSKNLNLYEMTHFSDLESASRWG